MTIHDDALSAFRKVYDDALTGASLHLQETQAELSRALTDIEGYKLQIEECGLEIDALKKRIAELENPVNPSKVGAVPLGEARYAVGNVVVSSSSELEQAVNSHKPGDVISMRAGTYTSSGWGDSYTKGKGAFTLQNYPGEAVKITPSSGSRRGFMIVKSPGVILRGFQLDGFVGDWSGNFGTLILADDPGDGSSASGATLENMHITNSTSFAVRAFGNRTRRLSGVTLRNVTLDGSRAKQILSTDWTDKFTVEKSIIRNANLSGVAFDNSEMAAWKDTVSVGLRADNVIVENAKNSVGVWLDQSCVDFAITNVDIKGKTQYAVHIELCGWGVVSNVKVTGDAKFAFYNKGSRNIRYWNNTFLGYAEVVWMDEQDERAGKTNAGDSRQPFISRGIDYSSRENEWVNNASTDATARYARMMIYDDQAKSSALGMVRVVSGNLLPVRAAGTTASLSLGTPSRRDYSVASAEALDPSKFYANSTTVNAAAPQIIPDDIATLIAVPRGSRATGVTRKDLA